MEKQTLTFTALPNGVDPGSGRARLSVFISQRLWSDTPVAGNITLDKYPDQLDWPARVAALTWEASINGGAPVALTEPSSTLNATLWSALFHNTTQVKPFRFEDLRGTPIDSFPTWEIHDTIRGLYGRASSDPAYGAGAKRPDLGVLANDPDLSAIARPSFPEPEPVWNPPETAAVPFPDAPPVKEKPEPEPEPPPPEPSEKGCGCGCLAWPLELLRRIFGLPTGDAKGGVSPVAGVPPSKPLPTPSFKTDVTPPAPTPPPGPGKSFLPPPLTPAQKKTRTAFDALDTFLKPFGGAEPKLPDAAKLAETWDFHQAISSLGDHPVMLRRLGLVLDLLLPPGTALPANGTISVNSTGVAWQAGTTIVSPRTRFVSAPNVFTAAPRPVQPEITNGFLRVDDVTRFRVIQNDVVGDAIKVRNAATDALRFALPVDRPGDMPGESGLPALRTIGISLVRHEIKNELADQFLRSCALNSFLASKDLSPLPPPVAPGGALPAPSDELFAEDLARGYRIDVFDTKTGVWRSLCERVGTYHFLEAAGGPITETDEGFVQLAATESRDPAAPEGLRAADTLFTWNGWSLVAPRPGLAIMKDDTHADPTNKAVTPFKIEVDFKAKKGSLPRLRFGRKYRLRARVADLAGNSVTTPDESAVFNAAVPQVTEEFTAVRYEPIAPPILMLQSAPVEGESVERLVIRTPAIGGLGKTTVRHVAPPKTSQLMTELHGGFDNGTIDGTATGYTLASRESNSVKDDGAHQSKPAVNGLPGVVPATPAGSDPWIQPAPLVSVKYLPDPQARGVGFTGLPGELSPDGVTTVTFANAWPNVKPFRIELKKIPSGSTPNPPNFAADTLTVELAPAQRATVRINSFFNPTDLDVRGVWQWTDELAPPNLVQVKNSAIKGQHWAHLPWRYLTLVHATQKPLEPPDVKTLNPKKKLGETFAVVDGGIKVHVESTARVQLLASWTDPIDDPAKDPPVGLPAVPIMQTQNAHVCEIEVPETAVGAVAIIDSGTKTFPKQEFHDTKYHHVFYTPVSVTRFREYFPAITNTPGATTETGVAFGADVLNSARPEMPKYLYALPVFEWSSLPGTPGVLKRRRTGGGLRIYLERPWFSSGEGELLGIVIQENTNFLTLNETLRPLVTFWGADPIWDGKPAPDHAEKAHFKNAADAMPGKLLAEDPQSLVTVIGYKVNFDPERRLWFADIRIDTGEAYWPFVRLALARFQRQSVDGAHLSKIVRADFIQLPPERHAEISVAAAKINVKVKGPVYIRSEVTETIGNALPTFGGSPTSNGLSEIEAVIEERGATDDPADELSWRPIDATRVLMVQNPAALGEWEGDITPTTPITPGLFRVTLKEFEWFRTDDAVSQDAPRPQIRVARRLVYADVFAL